MFSNHDFYLLYDKCFDSEGEVMNTLSRYLGHQ